MKFETILNNFGLNEKEIAVYLALVELGGSPVRLISAKSKVNRGTTYDILKSLIEEGLVSFYNKDTHQYFVAENPEKLIEALDMKQKKLEEVKSEIQLSMPELQGLFAKQGGKPQMKLYEGQKGVRAIMQDVLDIMSKAKDKTYYVFSSANVRKNVYQSMPDFSPKRMKLGIKVKAISLGEGGQLVGLDERKWIKSADLKSTYMFIYEGKIALVSLDDELNEVGIVIQNRAIFETQKFIFKNLWEKI